MMIVIKVESQLGNKHAEHGAMLAKLQLRRCKFNAAKNFFPTFRGGGFEPVKPPLKYGLVVSQLSSDIRNSSSPGSYRSRLKSHLFCAVLFSHRAYE